MLAENEKPPQTLSSSCEPNHTTNTTTNSNTTTTNTAVEQQHQKSLETSLLPNDASSTTHSTALTEDVLHTPTQPQYTLTASLASTVESQEVTTHQILQEQNEFTDNDDDDTMLPFATPEDTHVTARQFHQQEDEIFSTPAMSQDTSFHLDMPTTTTTSTTITTTTTILESNQLSQSITFNEDNDDGQAILLGSAETSSSTSSQEETLGACIKLLSASFLMEQDESPSKPWEPPSPIAEALPRTNHNNNTTTTTTTTTMETTTTDTAASDTAIQDIDDGDELSPHPQTSQPVQEFTNSEDAQKSVKFCSPPAITHHMDYRSKAEIRKAELEELRKKKLATPQAARLHKAEAPKDHLHFQERQRALLHQQRQNQKDAIENLHQYRADEELVLSQQQQKRKTRRESDPLTPDAVAPTYTASPTQPSLSTNTISTAALQQDTFQPPLDQGTSSGQILLVEQQPVDQLGVPLQSKIDEGHDHIPVPNTLPPNLPTLETQDSFDFSSVHASLQNEVEVNVDEVPACPTSMVDSSGPTPESIAEATAGSCEKTVSTEGSMEVELDGKEEVPVDKQDVSELETMEEKEESAATKALESNDMKQTTPEVLGDDPPIVQESGTQMGHDGAVNTVPTASVESEETSTVENAGSTCQTEQAETVLEEVPAESTDAEARIGQAASIDDVSETSGDTTEQGNRRRKKSKKRRGYAPMASSTTYSSAVPFGVPKLWIDM